MTPLKKCTKCGEEKPATKEVFYTHPKGVNGLYSICKTCCRSTPSKKECAICGMVFQPKYNKARVCSKVCGQKLYYKNNRDFLISKVEMRRQANPEKFRIKRSEHYQENKDRLKAKTKKYQKNNPDKVKVWRKRAKERSIENISDSYVKDIIRSKHRIPTEYIEHKHITAKRAGIKTHRLIIKLKKQLS